MFKLLIILFLDNETYLSDVRQCLENKCTKYGLGKYIVTRELRDQDFQSRSRSGHELLGHGHVVVTRDLVTVTRDRDHFAAL